MEREGERAWVDQGWVDANGNGNTDTQRFFVRGKHLKLKHTEHRPSIRALFGNKGDIPSSPLLPVHSAPRSVICYMCCHSGRAFIRSYLRDPSVRPPSWLCILYLGRDERDRKRKKLKAWHGCEAHFSHSRFQMECDVPTPPRPPPPSIYGYKIRCSVGNVIAISRCDFIANTPTNCAESDGRKIIEFRTHRNSLGPSHLPLLSLFSPPSASHRD